LIIKIFTALILSIVAIFILYNPVITSYFLAGILNFVVAKNLTEIFHNLFPSKKDTRKK